MTERSTRQLARIPPDPCVCERNVKDTLFVYSLTVAKKLADAWSGVLVYADGDTGGVWCRVGSSAVLPYPVVVVVVVAVIVLRRTRIAPIDPAVREVTRRVRIIGGAGGVSMGDGILSDMGRVVDASI